MTHWTTKEVPEYYKLVKRIARRDKKAFLSDQCKEIEENNRMGKTTDLFKKIRDMKGTFPAKMGSIKDRNGLDLTVDPIISQLQNKANLWRYHLGMQVNVW